MQDFARLSFRKYNSATPVFLSGSQNIVNAVLCWARPSKTKAQMIYVRWPFSKARGQITNICFARWSLRIQSQLYILLGWALQNTVRSLFGSAGSAKTQECPTYPLSRASRGSHHPKYNSATLILRWKSHRTVNATAFQNTRVLHLSFLQSLKRQWPS